QVADGQSFEIFDRVQVSSPIIFTTAFDQYAIKAFKLNSVDYLLKPIDVRALEQAIRKFKSRQFQPPIDLSRIKDLLQAQPNYKSCLSVTFGAKLQSLQAEDVAFFFSSEEITFL